MPLDKELKKKVALISKELPERIVSAFDELHDALPGTVERILKHHVEAIDRAMEIGRRLNQISRRCKSPEEIDAELTTYLEKKDAGTA